VVLNRFGDSVAVLDGLLAVRSVDYCDFLVVDLVGADF